jgi:ferredoxin-type protein NapH
MKRQQTRKILTIVMFVLFPVIYYFFSPYLIIMGASQGIITGSFVMFAVLFASSLFLGRVFCGWICPAGATQELCAIARNKGFKNGKKNLIKYAIWAPWIAIIALMFFQAGGAKALDPLYQTYYGISISDIYSTIMFIAIAALIAGIALAAGKRASCHTICWIAPFMIIGRKIRNTINWPSLQLVADKEKCVNCLICNQKCPMSLAVESMVQQNSMENSECILCGSCIDSCPKQVIKYSFGKKRNKTNFQKQEITP